MKLEDQCVSLEIARKLKDLNIKQESLFYWGDGEILGKQEEKTIYTNYKGVLSWQTTGCGCCGDGGEIEEIYSAFTASELGELLPNYVDTKKEQPFNNFRLYITKFISINDKMEHINNFIVNYHCDTIVFEIDFKRLTKNTYDPNLANAMGKILIYLIENNLMPIKENK